jgi:hypothetical protein
MFDDYEWLASPNYPEYEFGKSYLFYSIKTDKLLIATKLPGLKDKIKKERKMTKFGEMTYYPNNNSELIDDHFRYEVEATTFICRYPPGCLQSINYNKRLQFTISWYSDLEYIGEV